ncbi:4-hydroxyphenylpyruvate dioxygenase-like protein isoform X1 [Hippocampus comes]|uniref:4-hydroxyphenylpyruvate dioxygenase-like protein isoform X1 n=1 Tax=Hippocampus comes TaxID=109280 RepID=UPI00094E4925|nr:PREDICTED: 4-hydroxyphenylpyruvate dioxygenase-like protein isoform X1 [Hippocampus comes]
MAAYVRRMHHVSLHVSNVDKLANDLSNKFKFNLFATRLTERTRQLAFRTGSAVFVVNERANRGDCGRLNVEPQPPEHHQAAGCLYDIPSRHPVDTACNVCFEVDDVHGSYEALRRMGCSFPVPPTTVRDHQGQVTYAVLRSVVGNVCHTLIDKSEYLGSFLPGFLETEGGQEKQNRPEAVTHVDHITYACATGTSQQVLSWYQQLFGFQRFFIHRNDETDSGFVINQKGIGLRLSAMEYWKCGESGLSLPGARQNEPGCKFVLAESLPDQGSNQVNTFLEEHQAAGVQHIGLYTGDIVEAVRGMTDAGVCFFSPPPAYYTELGKLREIEDAGQDAQKLAQHGVLLDADPQMQATSARESQRYLLQVFTKPLFVEDTFFLELIERQGSSGFGEGNIRALWRSVQVYMDDEKLAGAQETAPQQSR